MELNQENFDKVVKALNKLQKESRIIKTGGATKLNEYSKEEEQALIKACKGTELKRGATKAKCTELIKNGWNEQWEKKRNAAALAKKYARLIA